MDLQRVKQIIESPDKHEVLHNGTPVWIENVYHDTANVTVMGTCKTMDVPLADLEETGKTESAKNRRL